MEMFLDITTVLAAIISSASGLWGIRAFSDISFDRDDIRHGRFDVMLFSFIVATTGVSVWHLAMMVHWAVFPGIVVTSPGFFIGIGFWNIVISGALVFGHVVVRLAYTSGNKEQFANTYLFGNPKNAVTLSR